MRAPCDRRHSSCEGRSYYSIGVRVRHCELSVWRPLTITTAFWLPRPERGYFIIYLAREKLFNLDGSISLAEKGAPEISMGTHRYRQQRFSAVNDTRRDGSPKQKTKTIDMNVSAKEKQIGVISALVEGGNIGRSHRGKTFLISVALSVTMLACADPVVAAQKPWPAGIFDLPGAISESKRIGNAGPKPWLNANVDGMRIRVGWKEIETADGVYDWSLIDECLANAATSGKVAGISVGAGIGCPAWLYGGDTFSDGIISGYTVESATAAFVAADIGRVLYSDTYPSGYTIIVSQTSTVATVSIEASKTAGNARFSILARHPVLSPFRVLTAPDAGIMSVPWDTIFLAKWKRFIAAYGTRYDTNPYLVYVPMGGLGQTGESRVAVEASDVAWFDANAIANGYKATDSYSAAVVAWKASTEAIMDTYMSAFPTTPPFITIANCFGTIGGGSDALLDIFAYAAANYPGRLGFMNAQLNAVTGGAGYSIISDNRATNPTGAQFLYSSDTDCGVAALSKCDGSGFGCEDTGDNPCLSAFDAVNDTLEKGLSIGCRFVE